MNRRSAWICCRHTTFNLLFKAPTRNPWEWVSKLNPELDQAHKALTSKIPGSKPRLVIGGVHNYRTRKRLSKKLAKGEDLLRDPVAIFENYCPEIMEQCLAFREVMPTLYQLGLKPSLLYPAKLANKTNVKYFWMSSLYSLARKHLIRLIRYISSAVVQNCLIDSHPMQMVRLYTSTNRKPSHTLHAEGVDTN